MDSPGTGGHSELGTEFRSEGGIDLGGRHDRMAGPQTPDAPVTAVSRPQGNALRVSEPDPVRRGAGWGPRRAPDRHRFAG